MDAYIPFSCFFVYFTLLLMKSTCLRFGDKADRRSLDIGMTLNEGHEGNVLLANDAITHLARLAMMMRVNGNAFRTSEQSVKMIYTYRS